MKFKRFLIKRNKSREKAASGFFNTLESGTSYIVKAVLPLLFPPVVSITSIYSHNTILILLNFSITIFYIGNEFYRFFSGQANNARFITTMLGLLLVLGITIYTSSALISAIFSPVNAILLANIITTSINVYFALKDLILPVVFAIVNSLLHKMGVTTDITYVHERPLSLEKDRFIIDKILSSNFDKKDTHQLLLEGNEDELNDRIVKINKLLSILLSYKRKYNERFLGNFRYKQQIDDIESRIHKLTVKGEPADALTFVNQKIRFKQSKIDIITSVKDEVSAAIDEEKKSSFVKALRTYFYDVPTSSMLDKDKKREKVLDEALQECNQEEQVQEVKISNLKKSLLQN